MSFGQVALTVKSTRLCNLRCTYCTDWRSGSGHTMSFEVLAHLIYAACTDPEHQAVTFGWHGGDPMVLPVSWYETALALQARYRRPGQLIRNRIQTNGTLVTDEWAEFLRREDIPVGVSIDGPRDVHDQTRVGLHGEGSFDRVVEGIGLLQSHDVKVGVLMTVDRATIELGAERTLEFLLALGVHSFGFNPVQPGLDEPPGDLGDSFLKRDEMNRFLIDVHRCWIENGDPSVHIRELAALTGRIGDGANSTCILAGDCVGTRFAVEPNGDIANCDRFYGQANYRFGSIMRNDFAHIRKSLNLLERRAADKATADLRRDCEHFQVCSGGCPQQTFLESKHDPLYDQGCCGRGELIDYLKQHPERPAQPVPVSLSSR